MKQNWEKNLIILSIIGLVVGSWGMFQRLVYGHLPMNYGSFVPWGLWVAFDLFFLGLTAGAFPSPFSPTFSTSSSWPTWGPWPRSPCW